MYVMLCTHLDICYAIWIINRYQSNLSPQHWIVVKHILKYFHRTREYMLICSVPNLMSIGYIDSNFQADRDSHKSASGSMFTLGCDVIIWRSIKRSCTVDSTMKAEYTHGRL